LYKELKIEKVLKTISKLSKRIDERMPNSSLSKVCEGLLLTAKLAEKRIDNLLKPNKYIRTGVIAVIILFILTIVYTFSLAEWHFIKPSITDLIQLSEALINDILLVSAALFFLITYEQRKKRRDVLEELHTLRSIAHVIDMHQLTKDPSMVNTELKKTPSSPSRSMTALELQRYLEYCSEMFSIIGKIAALFSERLPDPSIVSAANDIESLCTGLSRKVWQKMVFLGKSKS
jgi:hypothetical protein